MRNCIMFKTITAQSVSDGFSGNGTMRLTGRLRSRLLFLVAVTTFIVLTTVGCERGPKLEGLVPCRGAVMFQDEPLAGAIVTFSPKDNKPGVRAAVATTDDKGVFSLMTLGQKGIFPGEYRVSIVKNTAVETPTNRERAEQMQQGRRPLRPQKIESVIPAKFNDEKKSGLEFLIGEQGARELKIEIESLDTKIFPGAGKVL